VLSELVGDVGPEAAMDKLTLALTSLRHIKPEAAKALAARGTQKSIFDDA